MKRIEVQFTEAIEAKAAELDNDPRLIYEWVRNNVEFVPTYGSIQGADYCLQTLECNAFDTSSLLIALLRASGVHARYAMGTVQMPVDKFTNWVGGFTDAQAALDFAASGGIPATGLVEAGAIKAMRLEHVWVEAWVDMMPSMGANHVQGDTWVPLDASFKQYTYTDGMDISSEVPFDAEALVDDIVASAIINETDGSVTGMDSSIINTAMTEYRAQVEEFMSTQAPDATVGDVLGMKTIDQRSYAILMGTLPYKLNAMGTRHAELPDTDRHKLSFRVEGGDLYNMADPLDASYSLPEIAGKKITLSYSPATQADEAVINSYLPEPHPDGTPIDPSELPSSLPAYLINLKPELRVDGVVVATGGAVQMGVAEDFNMTFHDPVRSDDIIRNKIDAGEYFGIAVDVGRMSESMMNTVKARMEVTKAKLEAEDFTGLTKDELLGDLLYTTAMSYFAELDAFDFIQSRTMGLIDIRFPSEAIFKTSLGVDTSFGVPVSAGVGGLAMDADRIMSLTKSRDGDNAKKLQFMQASGMNSSALEHSVPEQLFSTPESPVEAISAVKAIQIAASQGIPTYTVTKDNKDVVLSQLELDTAVINEIGNAVNAGKVVTVSKTDINFHGWIGAGYIITDPTTGAGAYMISGGDSGAHAYISELKANVILNGSSSDLSVVEDPLKYTKIYLEIHSMIESVGHVLAAIAVTGIVLGILAFALLAVAGVAEGVLIALGVTVAAFAVAYIGFIVAATLAGWISVLFECILNYGEGYCGNETSTSWRMKWKYNYLS